MEELRTQAEYQSANDPLGLPEAAAQEIVNRLLAALLLAGGTISFAANRATLTGKVTDAAGKPLEDATVLVYKAGVKKGYSTFCPSCYTDCGKRAVTNASGEFTIDGLSRDLWFELLVVHDGYTPAFMKRADPLQGPAATAALAVRTPVDDPRRVVRGRVTDPQGYPMRNAVVTPFAIQVGDTSIYSGFSDLDPIAVTNGKGEFEIANSKATSKMALMVEARGMAPKLIILPTGSERHTIMVSDGVFVRGRLVENGKPVAGVEIGLKPKEPFLGAMNLTIYGSPYGEIVIGTREDGTFAIPNVPAPGEWYLYGKMESISSRGATNPVAITSARNDQEINVGDIRIEHGYRMRGKVRLSDGKPIADGMRMYIGSDQDSQSVLLPADGSFEFTGLAAGKYSLWSNVKGYQAPKGTPDLTASIDHDVDHFDVVLQSAGAAPTQH
jgi:hypothetical protein